MSYKNDVYVLSVELKDMAAYDGPVEGAIIDAIYEEVDVNSVSAEKLIGKTPNYFKGGIVRFDVTFSFADDNGQKPKDRIDDDMDNIIHNVGEAVDSVSLYMEKKRREMNMLIECGQKEATALRYKGIVFDDFNIDGDGHVWAELCNECAAKYGNILSKELDDGKTAPGVCGRKGCHHTDEDTPYSHYYVDFDPSKVVYLKEVK